MEFGPASDPVVRRAWFLAGGVLEPLCDGMVISGFLLPSLARYLSPWPAVFLSSLIFTATRTAPNHLVFVSNYFCCLAMGVLYMHGRSLWAPVFSHGFFNVSGVLTSLIAAWLAGVK